MSARHSQELGRQRLRDLAARTDQKDAEMCDEAERFRALDKTGAPRVASGFNLFQTPEPIAARMAELLRAEPASTLLEPSAGLGRLYLAARQTGARGRIVLVDNSPDCCRELYLMTETDENMRLHQADFLECSAESLGAPFDRIIMNPPFKNGIDIKHILRATGMLARGGRLVALCANGPRQNRQLRPIVSEWHDLEANSFRSEATSVSVALIVIDSPR